MKRLLLVASAVVVAAALAACSDSNGPGGASSVALLINDHFVDYDTSDYGAEASELQFTLQGFGVAVDPVTAVDSTSIAAALQNNHVFIVGEEESGSVADSLSAGARAAIRFWVDSSGGTLIVTPDDGGIALLDSLYGFTLVSGNDSANYVLNTADASGTPFAGAPGIVWPNDGTYLVTDASLPGGSLVIYTSAVTSVPVAVIPEGRGQIVLLGWDWYNAGPHGSQDGGWIDLLRRALRF